MMIIMGRNAPARSNPAAGKMPFAEEYVCGSCSAAQTSSYRLSTQQRGRAHQ